MVDKATARFLVYGALATLGFILIVAIYALATKGSLQSQLEAKLAELSKESDARAREAKQKEEALRRAQAADEERKREHEIRENVEHQKDEYKDKYEKAEHEGQSAHSESERLRRRLWDKTDQQKLEELEKLSQEQLVKELEQEGEQFFNEEKELANEHLDGTDKQDLDKELEAAKTFQNQFEHVKKRLDAGKFDRKSEDELETLEEFGERNEVLLDELKRDAKRKGSKWKEGGRAERMEQLVKDMDLHAEALRVKMNDAKLKQQEHNLDAIQQKALQMEREGDKAFAPQIEHIAKDIESDEERLSKELESADEHEELEAADQLEKDAELDRIKLAELKVQLHDSNLSPEAKQQRLQLIKDLEGDLDEAEEEAQHIEKGISRRHIRQNAVKMSKAVNRLQEQPLQKLPHAKKVIQDVEDLLKLESQKLQDLRSGNTTREEQASVELADSADRVKEDAAHMYDEARAAHFDDLDEKLIDEQLAKELEEAGEDMEHDAMAVDEDDRARDTREAGEHILEAAEEFGKKDAKQFGKAASVKKLAEQVEQESLDLGVAVKAHDFKKEQELAQRIQRDEDKLEHEVDDLQKEVEGADPNVLKPEDKKQDIQAIRTMREQGARLKREAKGILDDVQHHAQMERKKYQERVVEAEQLLQPAPKN